MKYFTSNEIKPGGWLKKELEILAGGLCGNLDKVWPDVRDSKWIGGTREGWERVPYWLDGFIPLAYLLENGDMQARAKKYIDAIIASQCDDGWICPCEKEQRGEYDTWALLLITKVLTVYYECSRDERIPDVIKRALKNFYDLLSEGSIKLITWGKMRWFEGFVALNFLYEREPEEWMTELAQILDSQGQDYTLLEKEWERPLNKWSLDTHVVNLAMMLKIEAITDKLLCGKYRGLAKRHYDLLMKYNGTAIGFFTGDECLSGISNIQGTELCAIAELMYSFEQLCLYCDDGAWRERLETVAYNGFFAAVSDDMWAHQYVQSVNQINCEKFPGKSLYRTNSSDAHIFGLEPNFGCCTANFGQALPKLALSAFIDCGDTVINTLQIPTELDCDRCSIRIDTEYPFNNVINYVIKAKKDFTLCIDVPEYCERAECDKKTVGKKIKISVRSGEEKNVCLKYHFAPRFEQRPFDLYAVKYGALVFSLPIEYEKRMIEYERDGVLRKFPYCDWEYKGKSEWRYGFAEDGLCAEYKGVSDVPFSSHRPPVTVTCKLALIDWDYADGYDCVCAKYPESRKKKKDGIKAELYPYGCAKLRITEMPKAE